STNTGGTVVPEIYGCSYKTFMNGKPHSFKGTEGVVGLKCWFEKVEQVFEICKCAEDDKVKFAMCTLHHHGPCPQKCQRCQRIGHMEKDYRVRLQGAGNDFLQNVTCFGCGEKGHFKDKCPKAGNQQNDGAHRRAYMVVENP
ncbi:putative reverse transcriptase domain-containing protein, partial [Tanacetum coccineum]